jgi:WD40 repeat protein
LTCLGIFDGKWLITGSEDGLVRVVDNESPDLKILQTFSDHEASVRTLAKI